MSTTSKCSTPQSPPPQVLEKCRVCGGLIAFTSRTPIHGPVVACDNCGRDYAAILRKELAWLDAALDADDAAQIAQLDPATAARMAMHIRQSILLNQHLDRSDATIVRGETFTAEDYRRMGIAAARYEARAAASRCCSHSYCIVYTSDPSGLCPGHRPYQSPEAHRWTGRVVCGWCGAELQAATDAANHDVSHGVCDPACGPALAAGFATETLEAQS